MYIEDLVATKQLHIHIHWLLQAPIDLYSSQFSETSVGWPSFTSLVATVPSMAIRAATLFVFLLEAGLSTRLCWVVLPAVGAASPLHLVCALLGLWRHPSHAEPACRISGFQWLLSWAQCRLVLMGLLQGLPAQCPVSLAWDTALSLSTRSRISFDRLFHLLTSFVGVSLDAMWRCFKFLPTALAPCWHALLQLG